MIYKNLHFVYCIIYYKHMDQVYLKISKSVHNFSHQCILLVEFSGVFSNFINKKKLNQYLKNKKKLFFFMLLSHIAPI